MVEPTSPQQEPEPPPIVAPPLVGGSLSLDDTGRITDDVACRQCGYNLHGLHPDGACPECETSIWRSVHGHLLRFCDPEWVDKLARGAGHLVIAIVAMIVVLIAFYVATNVMWAVMPGLPFKVIYGGLLAAWFVIMGAVAWGCWRITSPEPGMTLAAFWQSARGAGRVGLIVGLVLVVTGTVCNPDYYSFFRGIGVYAPGLTALSPVQDGCAAGPGWLAGCWQLGLEGCSTVPASG